MIHFEEFKETVEHHLSMFLLDSQDVWSTLNDLVTNPHRTVECMEEVLDKVEDSAAILIDEIDTLRHSAFTSLSEKDEKYVNGE